MGAASGLVCVRQTRTLSRLSTPGPSAKARDTERLNHYLAVLTGQAHGADRLDLFGRHRPLDLAEHSIPHEGRSKHADAYRTVPLDLVVTVRDAAAETCPVWSGRGRRVHLGFPDPAATTGSREEVMAVFGAVRDDIARKVPELLQLQGKDR